MLNYRLQMKSFVLASLLLVILLFPLNSFSATICWDEEVANRMEVSLEQSKITEQQLSTMVESSAETQNQLVILKETIRVMQDQISLYKSMIETEKRMSEVKDKLHADELKAAKPTFMENMSKYLVGVGIGGILATALALVL